MDQEFRNGFDGSSAQDLIRLRSTYRPSWCPLPSSQGFFFFFLPWGCKILTKRPGIEPVPSTGKAWSPNYWTTRLIPKLRRLLKGFKWQNSWCLYHNGFLYSINHIILPVNFWTERTHCSGLTHNYWMNSIWLWYTWYMVTWDPYYFLIDLLATWGHNPESFVFLQQSLSQCVLSG